MLPSLELLDSKYLYCRKELLLQGSCSPRTSLTGEASGKVAELTAKKKSTEKLADPKESSGAVRQESRKFRNVGQYIVVGKEQSLANGPFHWPSTDLTVLRLTSRQPNSAGYH